MGIDISGIDILGIDILALPHCARVGFDHILYSVGKNNNNNNSNLTFYSRSAAIGNEYRFSIISISPQNACAKFRCENRFP